MTTGCHSCNSLRENAGSLMQTLFHDLGITPVTAAA